VLSSGASNFLSTSSLGQSFIFLSVCEELPIGEIMHSTGLVDKNSPLRSLNMQQLTRLNIGFLLPLLTLGSPPIDTLNQLKHNNNQHEHHSLFTIPAPLLTLGLTPIDTLNQLKRNNNQHEHHSLFTIPASSRTFNTVSS
jgi:hypothetical protein